MSTPKDRLQLILMFLLIFIVLDKPSQAAALEPSDKEQQLKLSDITQFDQYTNDFIQLYKVLNTQNVIQDDLKKSDCSALLKKSNPKNINYKPIIECLTLNGRSAFSEKFYSHLFERLNVVYKLESNNDSVLEIKTLNLLMDLNRSVLAEQHPTFWYDNTQKTNKFLNLTREKRDDFNYQNGDLVLAFGGNGTSGIIGEVNLPVYRFSHAFLIQKTNNNDEQYISLETQPHTGAKQYAKLDIAQEKYSHIIVLRWKDQKTRSQVIHKTLTKAMDLVQKNTPFDFNMSSQDENKIYCTFMAAYAYAIGSHSNIRDIFSQWKTYSSHGLIKFAQHIGLSLKNESLTPKTILNSPKFDIVAEYRDTAQMYASWQNYYLTQLTADRYEKGFQIKPAFPYTLVKYIFKIPFISSIPLIKKSIIISENIGEDAFSRLATFEKKIIAQGIENTKIQMSERPFYLVSIFDQFDATKTNFNKNFNSLFTSESHYE